MLNEEKIHLMTRVSVYEEGRGINDDRMSGFFRGDYVFSGMIISFITGTLAWGICAAVYCGYFFENIFFSVYEHTFDPFLKHLIISYVSFMALYLLATFLVYQVRSMAYARRRRLYEEDLDDLVDICDKERM